MKIIIININIMWNEINEKYEIKIIIIIIIIIINDDIIIIIMWILKCNKMK